MQKHEMLFRRYVRWCCIAVTSLALIKYVQQHIPATTAPTMIAGDANGSAVVNFSGHAPTANRIVADPVRSTERTVVKEDTIIPQGKDESGRLWRFWNEVESGAATPDVPAVTVEEPAATPVEAPATPSLQPWEWFATQNEVDTLTQCATRLQNAVFLISNNSGQGTAFCISRKHRLLATSAHVVDVQKIGWPVRAVMSGTGHTFNVQMVWQHQKLTRKDALGIYVNGSLEPYGEIGSNSADVAIVQLEDNGYPLPAEFTLARPNHGKFLKNRAVAVMGFPGYASFSRLQNGQKAWPISAYGVAYHTAPISDIPYPEAIPPSWLLYHTAAVWYGSSGSPIITTNGLVIGIQNTTVGITSARDGRWYTVKCGIMVDALWELFQTAQEIQGCLTPDTDGKCPNYEPAPDRSWQRYPDVPREAQDLVIQGRAYAGQGKLAEAVQCANQACLQANWWWVAHADRANAYFQYVSTLGGRDRKSRDAQAQYAQWGWMDMVRAMHLNPSDPYRYISVGKALNYLSATSGNDAPSGKALYFAERMLENKGWLPVALQAELHDLRAGALMQFRRFDEALQAANEAIRINPSDPRFFHTRAAIYGSTGRSDLARQDQQTVTTLGTTSR